METAKKGGKFAAKARKCVARQANETGNDAISSSSWF